MGRRNRVDPDEMLARFRERGPDFRTRAVGLVGLMGATANYPALGPFTDAAQSLRERGDLAMDSEGWYSLVAL